MYRLFVATTVLCAAACGGDGAKGADAGPMTSPRDTTPPTVSATTPSSGATGASLRPTLEVEFSENMDSTSVSISVTPALSFGAPTALAPNRYSFAATADALPLTAYSATVSGSDAAGNALSGLKVFSFTTKASDTAPDAVSPKLLSTTPANSANGLARCDAPFVFKFSEPMDKAGVEASLEITGLPNRMLAWNADSSELTIKTVGCLDYGTMIRVIIGNNAKDLAGNSLNVQPTLDFQVVRKLSATFEAQYDYSGLIDKTYGVGYGVKRNEVLAGYAVYSNSISKTFRGYVSFGLASLPPSAVITEATLQMTARYARNDPFRYLGSMLLDHVAYGQRLIEEDYNTAIVETCTGPVVPPNCGPKTGTVTIATSQPGGSSNWTVTPFVVDDWSNRATRQSLTQMRVRFERDSYPTANPVSFLFGFHLNDPDDGQIPPKLFVTYEAP